MLTINTNSNNSSANTSENTLTSTTANPQSQMKNSKDQMSDTIDEQHIIVNIAAQTLTLYKGQQPLKCYRVSTAKNGIGAMEGSGYTPLGQHIIAEKTGADQPICSVFVGGVPTGEIYDAKLGEQAPERDWILSRILWLQGCEVGVNKGQNTAGCCDTYQRYIYIHGTPDTEPMGVPLSHGCIRMRNDDVVELFAKVSEGTAVNIVAQ